MEKLEINKKLLDIIKDTAVRNYIQRSIPVHLAVLQALQEELKKHGLEPNFKLVD